MITTTESSTTRLALEQDLIPRSTSTSSKSSTSSGSAGVGATEGVSSSGLKERQRTKLRRRHSFHDSPQTPTVPLPPDLPTSPTSVVETASEAEEDQAISTVPSMQGPFQSLSISNTSNEAGMYDPSPQIYDYHQSTPYPSVGTVGIPFIQPFGAYHNPYDKYGSWNSGYYPDQEVGGQDVGEKDYKTLASTTVLNINMDVIGERRKGKCKFFSPTKGFGFILDSEAAEIGGDEVFVHYSAIEPPSAGGRSFRSLGEVEYTLIHGNKGWQAQRVTGPGGANVKGAPAPSDIPPNPPSKHGSTYRASSALAPRYPYHSMRHSNPNGWGRDLIMTPLSGPEGIGYGGSGFFGSSGGGGSQGSTPALVHSPHSNTSPLSNSFGNLPPLQHRGAYNIPQMFPLPPDAPDSNTTTAHHIQHPDPRVLEYQQYQQRIFQQHQHEMQQRGHAFGITAPHISPLDNPHPAAQAYFPQQYPLAPLPTFQQPQHHRHRPQQSSSQSSQRQSQVVYYPPYGPPHSLSAPPPPPPSLEMVPQAYNTFETLPHISPSPPTPTKIDPASSHTPLGDDDSPPLPSSAPQQSSLFRQGDSIGDLEHGNGSGHHAGFAHAGQPAETIGVVSPPVIERRGKKGKDASGINTESFEASRGTGGSIEA